MFWVKLYSFIKHVQLNPIARGCIYCHKVPNIIFWCVSGDPESVAGEYGRHSLYKMLGYFSLVGLLRLHSLLGDYYQAIKVLENIELNKKVMPTEHHKLRAWHALMFPLNHRISVQSPVFSLHFPSTFLYFTIFLDTQIELFSNGPDHTVDSILLPVF